ncbi:MAG: hypothetical protein LBS27_07720, partial [Bifidobacteriaceae bacterium]|nr:hypothetical protein [Bifidobacteriaceae bacterium]
MTTWRKCGICLVAAGMAMAFAAPSETGATTELPGTTPGPALSVATGTVEGADQIPFQRAGPSEFFPVETDCLSFGDNGYQIWSGEFAPGLHRLSDKLSAIVAANEAVTAGGAICSDRSGAAVFVAERTPELMAQIDAVAAEYPSLPVEIVDVAVGAGTAMPVAMRLFDADFGASVTLVGVDVYTGGLLVSVLPEAMSREVDPITAETIHAHVL